MIFGISSSLKKAAMHKAQKHGLSYATVLKMATQAYVDGTLAIGAFDARLAQSVEDVQRGRTYTTAQVRKKLNIT